MRKPTAVAGFVALAIWLSTSAAAQTTSEIRWTSRIDDPGVCWAGGTCLDYRRAYETVTYEHYITCPGGSEVVLETSSQGYSYDSTCDSGDCPCNWPLPSCYGHVETYAEDGGTIWRAITDVTSSYRSYSSWGDCGCWDYTSQYTLTWQKVTSDQVCGAAFASLNTTRATVVAAVRPFRRPPVSIGASCAARGSVPVTIGGVKSRFDPWMLLARLTTPFRLMLDLRRLGAALQLAKGPPQRSLR